MHTATATHWARWHFRKYDGSFYADHEWQTASVWADRATGAWRVRVDVMNRRHDPSAPPDCHRIQVECGHTYAVQSADQGKTFAERLFAIGG